MQPGSRAVTVLAGPPPSDLPATEWGRISRSVSPVQRHAERLEEDEQAMEALGCPAIRLGIPELEYRPNDVGQDEIVGRVANEVAPLVAESSEMWVPAGIGGHIDHIATRDGVLAAWRSLGSSAAIRLYADQPYSIIMYGWPSWVTGVPDGEYLDIGAWLEQELISCGLDPSILVADVRELDLEMQQRKESAVMAYRTQLPGIGLGPNASRRWRDLLSHELSWRLTA
jgi:LmbE family N-acetylglucosaminyl deacetylase